MPSTTVLPVAVGYGVVVGIGFFFAAVMVGISFIQVSHSIPVGSEKTNHPRIDTPPTLLR